MPDTDCLDEMPEYRPKSAEHRLIYILFDILFMWIFLICPVQEAIMPDHRLQWEEENMRG